VVYTSLNLFQSRINQTPWEFDVPSGTTKFLEERVICQKDGIVMLVE